MKKQGLLRRQRGIGDRDDPQRPRPRPRGGQRRRRATSTNSASQGRYDAVTPPDLITKEPAAAHRRPDRGRADPGRGGQCQPAARPAGYPFARLGTRDILLDEPTSPATIRCRSIPGRGRASARSRRRAAGVRRRPHPYPAPLQARAALRHAAGRRSAQGACRDRPVLDGRGRAVDTGKDAADGTRIVDIAVTQRVGKTRSIAATAGYSTGRACAPRRPSPRATPSARGRADRHRGRRHAGTGRGGDLPPLQLAPARPYADLRRWRPGITITTRSTPIAIADRARVGTIRPRSGRRNSPISTGSS